MSTLNDYLDGACLVRYDDETGLMAVWNGSYTVNIFDSASGENTDVFSMKYNRDGSPAAIADVEESIADYFADARGEVR